MAQMSTEDWLARLVRQESGGNPNAISPKGAAGIMQVMPATGREIAAELGETDIAGMDDAGITRALLDPVRGKRYGEHYAKKQLAAFGGDPFLASIAYNAGPKRAQEFMQHRDLSRLPRETQGYVSAIFPEMGGGARMAGGSGADMMAGGGGADGLAGYLGLLTGGSDSPAPAAPAGGEPFQPAPWNERMGAMLYALGSIGSHDGGEVAAQERLRALNNQGRDENKTYKALLARGIDPATAEWAVRDPRVMQELAQQLFAPKSKNMTISEIFDPATGRPVKVLVDQTTGEYQPIGGVQAVDPTKAPNLQAIDVFDEATGRKRKAVFNPVTGQMEPLGGIEAADEINPVEQRRLDQADERIGLQRRALDQAAQSRRTRQLSVGDVEKLSKTGGELQQVNGFTDTFKDTYAGYSPIGAQTRMWAARTGLSGETSDPGTKEAAEWWQGYDRYKNVARNELFGASLTAGEQAAFEAADINPSMDPAIIRTNMKLQADLVKKGVMRLAQALVAAGYDPAPLAAAFGIDAAEITAGMPANAGGGPAAGTVEDGWRFKGGDPADPKNWEQVQ